MDGVPWEGFRAYVAEHMEKMYSSLATVWKRATMGCEGDHAK